MRVIWYFSSTCARYQADGTVGTWWRGGGDLGAASPMFSWTVKLHKTKVFQ